MKKILYLRTGIQFDALLGTYTALNVNYEAKTLDVAGDLSLTTSITLKIPFYIHGTPYAVNNDLDMKTKSKTLTYPIVYLLEIVKENIPDIDSAFSTIADIRLFFLDEANFRDWDTDKLYSYAVTPQRVYVNYVLSQMRNTPLFGLPSNIEITSFAKFGQYVNDKGMIQSIFNKNLSGVELRCTLPIVGCQCEC